MKILVLTVGGSSQPLVSSIKQNKPDKLAFLCSDDIQGTKGSYIEVEGKDRVCEKGTKPNIIVQADAANIPREIVKINNIDDPNACYLESLKLLAKLRKDFPEAQIIADYSGGTKSMSSGLVLAALDVKSIILGLQAGLRVNRDKVVADTQFTRLIHQHAPVVNRQRRVAADFLQRFDYDAAISLLEELLTIQNLEEAVGKPLKDGLVLSRALNAWDRFDHATAWRLLSPLRSANVELVKFLEAVVWSRRSLEPQFNKTMADQTGEKSKGHGYELVQDLLLNAKRRAFRGRYDDAVARLYRGMEMLAQAQLEYSHGIESDNVDIDKVPVALRPSYEQKKKPWDNKIRLGLTEDFELLASFPDDPLGKIYSDNKNKVRNFLAVRNKSLYAHGFTPIDESEYKQAESIAEYFFSRGIEDILKANAERKKYAAPLQFPQYFPGVWSTENTGT